MSNDYQSGVAPSAQKSHAEIIAECYHNTAATRYVRKLLERLEAAHKREVATTKESLAVGNSGDCAKLREALEDIWRLVEQIHFLYSDYPSEIHEIARKVNAALAAPARNCDKVKTSWDVLKEWHEGLDTANDVVRLLDWLLAPATGKEGGTK